MESVYRFPPVDAIYPVMLYRKCLCLGEGFQAALDGLAEALCFRCAACYGQLEGRCLVLGRGLHVALPEAHWQHGDRSLYRVMVGESMSPNREIVQGFSQLRAMV